jgi:hypothetical protein
VRIIHNAKGNILRSKDMITKDKWVSIMKAAGFSEKDMHLARGVRKVGSEGTPGVPGVFAHPSGRNPLDTRMEREEEEVAFRSTHWSGYPKQLKPAWIETNIGAILQSEEKLYCH